eukprot:gnl/MRDRNA2_/MRDRNA2_85794_c0_seq1.p1 gnl/MRDRNA2_/MRDRNA2_85794_c0~~gnl/MRDRNA2_/MRDRNA2_85794_c0_seq1.p1  ORF type:complete len:275 (-),score=31.36 gnl/MRDRNA2_/MRDRNA2_85794_c0_seq1:31-855(-)
MSLSSGRSVARLMSYVPPRSTEPSQKSVARTLCCCGPFGLDGGMDYSLSPSEEQEVAKLQCLAQIAFDPANPDHEELLREYFRIAQGMEPPEGRRHKAWKELGFQSEDPRTDFRGGGLLSLQCMLFMMQEHTERMQKMMMECAEVPKSATGQLTPSYPLSAAVVNVCFDLAGWLYLDPRRPPKSDDTGCPGKGYRCFGRMLDHEPKAFQILVACSVFEMHSDWVRNKRGTMGLGESLYLARRKVAAFLVSTPDERPDPIKQIISRLRETWEFGI